MELNLGNAPSTFNGLVTVNGKLIVSSGIVCVASVIGSSSTSFTSVSAGHGAFGTVAAPFKKFDIPHPSKEFPHRLAHACLEGPEIGVYVRGILKGDNEIELPYYWKDLVDEDSITVQLTPIGKHQNLCYNVAKMKDRISILVNPHEFNNNYIHCSYTVYAERKDVKKLVVEYKGARRMTVDPQDIAKRLRENRETTKKESTALTEQLAIIDAVIDEYDEVINKIDSKIQPLLPPINQKITAVQHIS